MRDLPVLLRRARFDVLPITLEHALTAGALPRPTGTRSTACAQALREGCAIVTGDPAFADYHVPVL